nr:MAG TPA: hypothetical protein [Caudoviricetes sp.]
MSGGKNPEGNASLPCGRKDAFPDFFPSVLFDAHRGFSRFSLGGKFSARTRVFPREGKSTPLRGVKVSLSLGSRGEGRRAKAAPAVLPSPALDKRRDSNKLTGRR